jgi:hypothetical protein
LQGVVRPGKPSITDPASRGSGGQRNGAIWTSARFAFKKSATTPRRWLSLMPELLAGDFTRFILLNALY